MKKLDKLILKAFFGPFILTYCIVTFILLCKVIIDYFENLLGKDLGAEVYVKLLYYFVLNLTPMSLPLAVLLSSLMTFGNLGEHFELTAIKSAGISLLRILRPIFIFILLLTGFAYYFNNTVVPYANLKAYSLLYDVKQKKATLEFKEGAFYYNLPGYVIKVNKKYEDGKSLKDIIIYNHTAGLGNTEVIIADSAQMYMFNDNRYMALELFDGMMYTEMMENRNMNDYRFVKNKFEHNKIVFSLESFDMERTKEELFAGNKIMRNTEQLLGDIDSIAAEYVKVNHYYKDNLRPFHPIMEETRRTDTLLLSKIAVHPDSFITHSKIHDSTYKASVLQFALNNSRNIKSYTVSYEERLMNIKRDKNSFDIELHRKFTQSLACLVMFLIGAPLGAIIKKGGLGVPVLISITFFIIYYVFSIQGENAAKEDAIPVWLGMWISNAVLFPVGLFFLRQARNDSRLLESDYLLIIIDRMVEFVKKVSKNLKK